ncbi:hypothetical protein LINPERPRIM_LOCUS45325 [Linum perenne]
MHQRFQTSMSFKGEVFGRPTYNSADIEFATKLLDSYHRVKEALQYACF